MRCIFCLLVRKLLHLKERKSHGWLCSTVPVRSFWTPAFFFFSIAKRIRKKSHFTFGSVERVDGGRRHRAAGSGPLMAGLVGICTRRCALCSPIAFIVLLYATSDLGYSSGGVCPTPSSGSIFGFLTGVPGGEAPPLRCATDCAQVAITRLSKSAQESDENGQKENLIETTEQGKQRARSSGQKIVHLHHSQKKRARFRRSLCHTLFCFPPPSIHSILKQFS